MSQAPIGGGPFIKAAEIQGKETVKITSEADWCDSQWTQDDGSKKQQYVCEVEYRGDKQRLKLTVASCQAIAPAYGRDSKDWVGKSLYIEAVNVMVGSSMKKSIYATPTQSQTISAPVQPIVPGQQAPADANDPFAGDNDVPF